MQFYIDIFQIIEDANMARISGFFSWEVTV